VRGEATRQVILVTAERLFAERGISAVPLRDIGVAAGQRNHAAVQYHFGDRDELVKAIMESRGSESEASRTEIVTGLMLGTGVPTVADVVDAFVRPLAIHILPNNHYLAFLSHLITERGGYEGLHGVHAGASVLTLGTLVGRLLPTLPRTVVDERWSLTMTSSVHALSRYQSALQRRENPLMKIEVLIGDLIAFLAAGLHAPLPEGDPRAGSSD
jgi:AcrR family transcriptional regulator